MTTATRTTAEAAARATLGLVADYPGWYGRIMAARILSGYHRSADQDEPLDHPSVASVNWTITETVAIIHALTDGGLLATTRGARPTLVLTRAGFRALEAIEIREEG